MVDLPRPPRRSREGGAALVVVIVLVSALLLLGLLVMQMQVSDTRSANVVVDSRRALSCAESGLAGARGAMVGLAGSWAAMIDGDDGNDPAGYPFVGDLDGDGDGDDDWQVTLKDNDDDFPVDDPTIDRDGAVFMVSTCLAYPDTPREVTALVGVAGGGSRYRSQAGAGGGNTGNSN